MKRFAISLGLFATLFGTPLSSQVSAYLGQQRYKSTGDIDPVYYSQHYDSMGFVPYSELSVDRYIPYRALVRLKSYYHESLNNPSFDEVQRREASSGYALVLRRLESLRNDSIFYNRLNQSNKSQVPMKETKVVLDKRWMKDFATNYLTGDDSVELLNSYEYKGFNPSLIYNNIPDISQNRTFISYLSTFLQYYMLKNVGYWIAVMDNVENVEYYSMHQAISDLSKMFNMTSDDLLGILIGESYYNLDMREKLNLRNFNIYSEDICSFLYKIGYTKSDVEHFKSNVSIAQRITKVIASVLYGGLDPDKSIYPVVSNLHHSCLSEYAFYFKDFEYSYPNTLITRNGAVQFNNMKYSGYYFGINRILDY